MVVEIYRDNLTSGFVDDTVLKTKNGNAIKKKSFREIHVYRLGLSKRYLKLWGGVNEHRN